MFKLNEDKTKFIIFGTKYQLSKAESASTRMAVGYTKAQAADQIHNLGFFMDNTLKNQVHINNLTSSAFNQMLNIRRICSKLDRDTTRTIIQALVMSKLNYCNSLLLGSAAYQLKKIQRIQNMACRIVCNLHKFDHVTPSMHDLHWLTVPQRIQFKIAYLMYKCMKGQALKCLTDLLPTKPKAQQLCLPTSDILPPILQRSTLAYNASFPSVGPRLWNSLPDIQHQQTKKLFRSKLKTHLFKIIICK